MAPTTYGDFVYIGICLEGFLYGLYSGIFAVYLQLHTSAKSNYKTNILFYALCVLYFLSMATIVLDVSRYLVEVNLSEVNILTLFYLDIIETIVFGLCDFIAQSILIYRCWVVWGKNIRVVVIPSILAFAFLVTWTVAGSVSVFINQGILGVVAWGDRLIETSITLSMTVNALVTCLIVVKIFEVFREVSNLNTPTENTLSVTGGRKLQSVIFILIESGMVLFSVQLARLVVTILTTDAATDAFTLIGYIHQMVNGITPTIILVRVSMGLTFHDKIYMEETAGSMHFATGHESSILEISQEKRDGSDIIEIKPDDDMLDVNHGKITLADESTVT